MRQSLTARPYESGDYEFVYELKKLCYRDYVEAIWGWDEADQREMFARYIKTAAPNLLILLEEGTPVGFVEGEENGERYDLGNICLLPAYRGRGLGSEVLRELLAACPQKTVCLQVFKTNPARRLYERLGFQITGENEHHYLMERRSEKP